MPADERGRLFDKLYRGAGVGEIAGAGLGLAIARALVEAHGGAIRVAERGDGPGAVFEFTLPNSPQPLPGVDDDGGVSEAP